MKEIYLDNSATTAVCKKAKENVLYAMEKCYYNPSSLYGKGMQAGLLVDACRNAAADILHCKNSEIYFTSCGTESNNTAIFGAAMYLRKRGNRIVTTAVEHPSVENPISELEQNGFEVIRLKPDKSGVISCDELYGAINEKTILVSMMAVNNETGAVMPIEKAHDAIIKAGAPALFHCDAVQAFCKKEIDVKKLNIDLLSCSGHKIHAPKGVGILYMGKNVHIKPLLFGGGQEKGFRSGTESVPLIHGLAGAMGEVGSIKDNLKYITELRDYGVDKLKSIEGITFNSAPDAFPYIINISVLGFRSETLLHFLEADGIYVSSGSACSRGKASRVLMEMGIEKDVADSALRISLSRYNTKEDFDALVGGLRAAKERLRRK